VYGVAAHPAARDAVSRLFVVKGRDGGKPIPYLAAGIAEVEGAGVILCECERRLAERFWPGALTLVLRPADPGEKWTEGFRVPAHEGLMRLLRMCGGLLRVTSANLSGDPPALTAAAAMAALGAGVGWALDGGRSPGGVASTVVRVDNGRPVVLRPGALSVEQITEACA
jgi:L-threonylcarbamoyladenylate synthase